MTDDEREDQLIAGARNLTNALTSIPEPRTAVWPHMEVVPRVEVYAEEIAALDDLERAAQLLITRLEGKASRDLLVDLGYTRQAIRNARTTLASRALEAAQREASAQRVSTAIANSMGGP